MHVDIEKTGRQYCIAEVDERGVRGKFLGGAGGDLRDSPVFHDEKWIRDLLGRSEQTACGECSLHGDV